MSSAFEVLDQCVANDGAFVAVTTHRLSREVLVKSARYAEGFTKLPLAAVALFEA